MSSDGDPHQENCNLNHAKEKNSSLSIFSLSGFFQNVSPYIYTPFTTSFLWSCMKIHTSSYPFKFKLFYLLSHNRSFIIPKDFGIKLVVVFHSTTKLVLCLSYILSHKIKMLSCDSNSILNMWLVFGHYSNNLSLALKPITWMTTMPHAYISNIFIYMHLIYWVYSMWLIQTYFYANEIYLFYSQFIKIILLQEILIYVWLIGCHITLALGRPKFH